MTKLSNQYRTDPDTIDPQTRDKIDADFLPTLANFEHANPKLLVVFSGGNAMGKSTLSHRIAQELHAVVLENDAMKQVIMRLWPQLDRDGHNALTWAYGMDLYRRLPDLTGNGLIVRDGVIDWYYDRILPVFQAQGYKVFIVQYDIDKAKAAELIKQRGNTATVNVERLLLMLDEHAIHQQRFRGEYTADVVLNAQNVFDHDLVVSKIRQELAKLSQ